MKNNEFKTQIENFLNEIETRKQEVLNGELNCKNQVGKSLFDYARKNFRDSYPLVYSVQGIRLDVIFHLGEKNKLHNASNFDDIIRLYNAIRYEILANKKLYENITIDEFYYVYWGYLVRLAKNFNWSSTLNNDNINQFGYLTGKQISYLQWMSNNEANILSNYAVEQTYKRIFIEGNNMVKDINGDIKRINIKNSDYNTMKKISKDELIDIINKFQNKPTVKEITDSYMSSLSEEEKDDKYVSKELMRAYIKSYELEDMIKTCNHTEKFNNKKK